MDMGTWLNKGTYLDAKDQGDSSILGACDKR